MKFLLLPLFALLLCFDAGAAQKHHPPKKHPAQAQTVRQDAPPPASPGMKPPPTRPNNRPPGFMDDGASKHGGKPG